MYCKLALAVLAVIVKCDFVSGQQIPSATTAAELWNPWTWFWPYAIATAEGYRDYYEKAQKATNELYQQIYKTNAFPWGNWSIYAQSNQEGSGSQTGQDNQGESNGQTGKENSAQPNSENPEKPQDTTPIEEYQTGTGAQVQGNVQNDGTTDAEANANVEGEEIEV